jgi:C-terminal processing protease CtpA/Prc
MPGEMRFCRACGFRLGEGVSEFTETVRFPQAPRVAAQAQGTQDARATATAGPPKLNPPFGNLHEWGALAVDFGQKAVKSATEHLERQKQQQKEQKKLQKEFQQSRPEEKRHRSKWMGWIIAFIILSVLSSGGFAGLRGLRQLNGSSTGSSASRSWVGTNDLETADGGTGVTFDNVEPAGSPADEAGLVGGDVITSFDNQNVRSSSELMKLLTTTPVGKTVEVVYIRDGETRTTKLTTISRDEIKRLEAVADKRTEGFIGEGTDLDRVPVPGTNIYGVQLNDLRENNPAEIAGLRDGDIVIEFGGIPTRTRRELETRIERAEPGSTVKVIVMRGGERIEIPVRIGHD